MAGIGIINGQQAWRCFKRIAFSSPSDFDFMNLELMAMRWLWLEKDCHYILEQRCPKYHNGSPDVIGITKARYLIEVEIKRSAADFRADAAKPHRSQQRRDSYFGKFLPKQIYYMMPRELAEKLLPEIPEWAGLMCDHESNHTATVLKVAPTNLKSERMSVKECVKTARLMCNHMMSVKHTMAERRSNWIHRDDLTYVQWVDIEQGSYEI